MRVRNGGHAGEGGADNRDLVDGDGSQNLSRNWFIQRRSPTPLNIQYLCAESGPVCWIGFSWVNGSDPIELMA